MEKEHKKFVIRHLFGLIEGSPSSLQRMMKDNFKRQFGIDAEISVTHTNKYIVDDKSKYSGCWIGSMTPTLTVNGESFTITRDWGEEHEINSKHPDYNDDWFYDSDKTYGYIKSQEALEQIDKEII